MYRVWMEVSTGISVISSTKWIFGNFSAILLCILFKRSCLLMNVKESDRLLHLSENMVFFISQNQITQSLAITTLDICIP